MKRLYLGALAISLAIAAPAMAQRSPSTMPPTSAPMTQPGEPGNGPAVDARSAASDASVTTGMAVMDNTGATIGSVAAVQPGPTGNKLATIQMGAKTFTVDTTSLAVTAGAATVNASKTQIEGMLPK
jgi:hypothetical protein